MRYRVKRRDFCEPNVTLPNLSSAIAYVDAQDGDHRRIEAVCEYEMIMDLVEIIKFLPIGNVFM